MPVHDASGNSGENNQKKGGEKMFWMRKEWRVTFMALFVAAAVIGLSNVAMAIPAPVAGSFAFDIYDVAVNGILKGPIGFVGGVAAIVIGAIMAIRAQIMGAIPAVLGGAALVKADSITTSLGALIQ